MTIYLTYLQFISRDSTWPNLLKKSNVLVIQICFHSKNLNNILKFSRGDKGNCLFSCVFE